LQIPSREIRNLSTCKLYYFRSVTAVRHSHKNRTDIVVLDKTITEAYLKDVALPHSHNLYSTITEKLQKYTHSTEIRQLNAISTTQHGEFST
jgi:hypothetical protein